MRRCASPTGSPACAADPAPRIRRRRPSRRPRLTVKEDESLREGLVLRVGDFVLDASLAGQLAGLRTLARELADDLAHDAHARTAWRDGSPDASSARGPT